MHIANLVQAGVPEWVRQSRRARVGVPEQVRQSYTNRKFCTDIPMLYKAQGILRALVRYNANQLSHFSLLLSERAHAT